MGRKIIIDGGEEEEGQRVGQQGGMRVLILSLVKRVMPVFLITLQVQRPHGGCAGLKAPNRCSVDRVFFMQAGARQRYCPSFRGMIGCCSRGGRDWRSRTGDASMMLWSMDGRERLPTGLNEAAGVTKKCLCSRPTHHCRC